MPTYETVFITVPSLTDQEETDLVGSLAQIVSDDGGALVANDRMGRRRLAYPLRKFEDGVYTRFLYDATPEVPKELGRRIGLTDKVLRHLTVRLELDWAVAAKEQWARDVEARKEAARVAALEAEAQKKAAEEAAAAAAVAAAAEAAAAAAAPDPEEESGEADPEVAAVTPDAEPAESSEASSSEAAAAPEAEAVPADDKPADGADTEAQPEDKA